ncbi:cobalt ABC transporter [Fervidicella metallireducens AeB]|uniref:Cobalt ABC transporter n=1 Tax=Fervidicella metallireducens AeB TaxID=1403537 RepID=A0A017RWJ1_9CLOT|nr:ABC transporter ATP-binding protein [Fervidicella metallireducens]EYE89128.1 cobalt ABC transporter [Fervidicella metallireducens AeB]
MIEINNITFEYNGLKAIDNISIKIEKGESIAIIGPNGSGKSTFLKILNALIFPSSGDYIFNGEKITPSSMNNQIFSKKFHKKIGFVFQNSDSQLFCSSVYDEIAFGPRQMGLSEIDVKRRCEDCLRLLNIEDLKDRVPFNLSGGEKKRVAIACVLSSNPEVIVLDEPMNGLDPRTKRFFRELLIKLNQSGKTVICATHDFEYVKDVFKRAIVFSKNHRIIRDDHYDKVINDSVFLFENNII